MNDQKNDNENVFVSQKPARRKGVGYGVLKLWQYVLILLILLCVAGVPATFVFTPDQYEATARIHVARYVAPVFSDPQNDAMMPGYESFRDTQAANILSEPILQNVTEKLGNDQSLSLFAKKAGLASSLKQVWAGQGLGALFNENRTPVDAIYAAMDEGRLIAQTQSHSEFIKIAMRSPSKEEAGKIVETLLQAYDAEILPSFKRNFDQKISALKDEYTRLSQDVKKQQEGMDSITTDEGGIALASRYAMIHQQMEQSQKQLTLAMAHQAALKNKMDEFEDPGYAASVSPGQSKVQRLKELRDYTNSDARYVKLIDGVIRAEYEVNDARQNYSAESNVVRKKMNLLKAIEESLVHRKNQLELEYHQWAKQRDAAEKADGKARMENERTATKLEYQKATQAVAILEERLKKESQQAMTIEKKQAIAQKHQKDLRLSTDLRDAVQMRIMQLEIERNRQPRITVHHDIASRAVPYKAPVKNAGGLLLAILLAGGGLWGQKKIIHRRYG